MADLFIKNMVCARCVLVVEAELAKLGLKPLQVDLGRVVLSEPLSGEVKPQLEQRLKELGFELLDDSKTRQIEAIKNIVIQKIHHSGNLDLKVNWSHLVSGELHQDYAYLSNLFSSVEGVTLEQYIIRQKIEKVKELLFYDELNMTEIAFRVGYSSVQHLSSQFRKVTGQTPSEYKSSRKEVLRKPIDSVI
ncbi:helix-turn-helix domain-containing protein [Arcticibacter sp. MXS-1]|uniref:helix-turn-helix domain-containing protein n=1 Tax=Arcticibacter sp. MXS-1 TaxID=3341726 RepID=UPI0035A8A3D3